ncbi:MAG: hypothetical protein AAEJ65_08410 [Planctomycetota bacterium]
MDHGVATSVTTGFHNADPIAIHQLLSCPGRLSLRAFNAGFPEKIQRSR